MQKFINKILSKFWGELLVCPKSKLQTEIKIIDPEPITFQLKDIDLGESKIFYRVIKN